jgi:hypothetical protein
MEDDYLLAEHIESRIYFVHGKKVMLDRDLAMLYGVTTGELNQAVKRNIERFPDDFRFELSHNEALNLISQIVTSSSHHGGNRKTVVVFTELGVAMLSSVLRSKQAIAINIQIMRTFTKLREILASREDLRLKLEDLERRYDSNFRIVFDALRKMIANEEEPRIEIGFRSSK